MTLIIFWTGWAVFRDSQWILSPGRSEAPSRPMLQDRCVGLGYYRSLLLDASSRFPPRRSWVGVPDAISGLPSRDSVCRILDGWNLRLDAGRPDRQAE